MNDRRLSMETIPIPHESLTAAVRRLLATPTAEIERWETIPLVHRVINRVTGGVYRVRGFAHGGEQSFSWSLVLKILHHPEHDPASQFNPSEELGHWNYWRREALVYESDLLNSLPITLAAPRCFGVSEVSPQTLYLWLEDIEGTPAADWPLLRFGEAARQLGLFQGGLLVAVQLPSYPWLSDHWLRSWVPDQPKAVLHIVENAQAWRNPLTEPYFPLELQDRVLRLWNERDRLLATLESLPQTLCHLDLWPPNLSHQTTPAGLNQTVLIDWSQVGYGAAGEDIANLVLDSIWMFRIESDDLLEYEQFVWQGYLAGLREAGWHGDEREVRFVYAAVAALRFGLLAGHLLQTANDSSVHSELEERYKRSIETIFRDRARCVHHALLLGDEALMLL